MLAESREHNQEVYSVVMAHKDMLPFPQPRWRYCHSALSKLHSVVDEMAHLLEYICTHKEYINSHLQELWVEMRMLQLKEHSAIALVNTSLTEVQRPFRAYWEYREYINNSANETNNDNINQNVSTLYTAYTQFVEEREQLSLTFSKHDDLIRVFVNHIHNQHQEKETLLTHTVKADLHEEASTSANYQKEGCGSEKVKAQKEDINVVVDVNTNVEILLLSCKDLQTSISHVARSLIALCEPNLLHSSSSLSSFAVLPKANNIETSKNYDSNNTSGDNYNIRKRTSDIENNNDKEGKESFYDSEHMCSDNNTRTINLNNITNTNRTISGFTTAAFNLKEYSKIKKELQKDVRNNYNNNNNRPMSNTELHMSSFESNDSNTTHDTVPHTLCKTNNTIYNKEHSTNTNCRINNNINDNDNTVSNNDKLQMPNTWQTNYKPRNAENKMSEYSLHHIQEILEKGLYCIQAQLSELTHAQHEMMNKINNIFVNNVEINKNSDTEMEIATSEGRNSNETSQAKAKAKYRAEIHALQATLFAWQESTKRLSHTLELTQTALRDEQIRSSRVEEENKSLQLRIDELITSRRRYGTSPEQLKQPKTTPLLNKEDLHFKKINNNMESEENNLHQNALQDVNIKKNEYYMCNKNINSYDKNNLEFTPIAQLASTTIHGRTPIAQIRAGIQRRLMEVAELANSLERVKVSEKEKEEELEEKEQKNETCYDKERCFTSKHSENKNASGNVDNEGKTFASSESVKKSNNSNLQRSASKSVSEVDVSISPLSQDNSVMCDEPEYDNNCVDVNIDEIDDDGCDVIDISKCKNDSFEKINTNDNVKKDNNKRENVSPFVAPQPSVKRLSEMNDAENVLQNAKRLLARLHNRGQ